LWLLVVGIALEIAWLLLLLEFMERLLGPDLIKAHTNSSTNILK
jgi:hypothetical protein